MILPSPTREIRPIRFYDNAVFIELTRGQTAVIDAEDAFLIAPFNWFARPDAKGSMYAITNGYNHPDGARHPIPMHRLIMQAPAGILVDHRDGNGLNNRRSNLRLADRGQNARNKPRHRNNKSGVKGVHWHVPSRRWIASITHNGVRHSLGSFERIEDAAAAYNAAASRLHGDFAWSAPK